MQASNQKEKHVAASSEEFDRPKEAALASPQAQQERASLAKASLAETLESLDKLLLEPLLPAAVVKTRESERRERGNSILSEDDKKYMRRQHIIKEIVDTEKSYVNGLQTVVEVLFISFLSLLFLMLPLPSDI